MRTASMSGELRTDANSTNVGRLTPASTLIAVWPMIEMARLDGVAAEHVGQHSHAVARVAHPRVFEDFWAPLQMAQRELWRHPDDKPTREEAIARVGAMLAKLIDRAAKEKIKLAPLMGIGCSGLIDEHGVIRKGGRSLPGNWEGADFSLAAARRPTCRATRVRELSNLIR
jgi:hypothetical protein